MIPLIDAITSIAHGGDHILIMSNGGFEGIHDKLMKSLSDQHRQLS
jgi:UDP-N-acetylmuramate: L-alanyl-gamma-D-glutamyl-meso-diaminopimelate ligase